MRALALIAAATLVLAGCRSTETPIPGASTPVAAADTATTTAAEDPTAAPSPAVTSDPTLQALYESFAPPVLGDPDAPVLLYEMSDYACPFCRRYALETAPSVYERYVETGRVAVVFIDVPIASHGYPSYLAHESAHCASEQGRYWEMHDALFDRQADLTTLAVDDEAGATEAVMEIGTDSGLDEAELRACLDSKKYRPIVASLSQQALDSGITATPTLMVKSEANTEAITGFVPFEDLEPVIERELERAEGE